MKYYRFLRLAWRCNRKKIIRKAVKLLLYIIIRLLIKYILGLAFNYAYLFRAYYKCEISSFARSATMAIKV